MYRIINCNGGADICKTEKPRYVKRKDTGILIQTDEANAQGVVVGGTPYNIYGKDGIGVEPTAMVVEYDGGAGMDMTQAQVDANSAAIDELTIAILEG